MPDISHQEQMLVILMTVSLEDTSEVKEHLIGFLVAKETTGQGLANLF